jgi:putative CocE/NonD family hydrolase
MGKHWRRWLDDHATDHFRYLEKHREIDVPALTITGWYDQQIGTIKHFTGMVKNGRSARARQSQRLIIGPWTHTLTDLGRKVGQVDFGALAQRDYYEIADRWFTRWLKDAPNDDPNDDDERPPIEVFVMGSNRWRHEREWPLAGTRYTDFFLRSGGGANTASGDGGLSREAPGEEPADEYRYDPRDPVMTLYSAQGHRIRLDISSSDFPNFDRNHNTGGADYAEAVLNSAHQQILHDSVHPSRLILPVIG